MISLNLEVMMSYILPYFLHFWHACDRSYWFSWCSSLLLFDHVNYLGEQLYCCMLNSWASHQQRSMNLLNMLWQIYTHGDENDLNWEHMNWRSLPLQPLLLIDGQKLEIPSNQYLCSARLLASTVMVRAKDTIFMLLPSSESWVTSLRYIHPRASVSYGDLK